MERNIGGRISQFLASTILLGPQPVSSGAVGLPLLNFTLLSSSASQRREQSMRDKRSVGSHIADNSCQMVVTLQLFIPRQMKCDSL